MTPDEAGPPGSIAYEEEMLLVNLRAAGWLGRALAWHYRRRLDAVRRRRHAEFPALFRQVVGKIKDDARRQGLLWP